MNIKSSEKTIKDILGTDRQFTIPRFQREYSWDKNNYKEFFDDIINSFGFEDGKIVNVQYFIGAMLFIGDYADGKSTPIQVVDGQQRLTTITILFSALSAKFRELEQYQLSEQIFKYIMTTGLDGEDVRILQSKTHYPFFAYYIQDIRKEHYEEPSTEEENALKNTYDFFMEMLQERKIKNNLKKRFEKIPNFNLDMDYIEILKAIRNQVLMIKFISISTTEKEQANRIFEILNGKGKKLASIDLIKNKIFEVLKTQEPVDFAEEKWKELKYNLCFENEDIGIGAFLKHYWATKYSNTSMNGLADAFEKRIKPKNEATYKSFLLELCEYSKLYMKIVKPSKEHYGNKQAYIPLVQSLKILSDDFNITQTRVPLMALLKSKSDEKLTLKNAIYAVEYLEHFHFVYNALFKKPTNKLESIYGKFSRLLLSENDKSKIFSIIENELISKLTALMPQYAEFEDKFVALTYSSKPQGENVVSRYITRKIHLYFNNEDVFPENGSIEHIIPESNGRYALEIGNLILLERNLNDVAKSDNYIKKKEIYKQSGYTWIHNLIEKYDNFDQEDIVERGKLLARLYYEKILKLEISE